jgi:hypothetical protein
MAMRLRGSKIARKSIPVAHMVKTSSKVLEASAGPPRMLFSPGSNRRNTTTALAIPVRIGKRVIIWANSTRVGCASVACYENAGGGTFITCNYDPPGNKPGEWPYLGCLEAGSTPPPLHGTYGYLEHLPCNNQHKFDRIPYDICLLNIRSNSSTCITCICQYVSHSYYCSDSFC